jgi:hypothetical protein
MKFVVANRARVRVVLSLSNLNTRSRALSISHYDGKHIRNIHNPIKGLIACLVTTITSQCRTKQAYGACLYSPLAKVSLIDHLHARSLSAGRAQERRNVQWTPRQLRQLYEHHAPRGIPDERRGRPLLESQRVLHPR